MGFFVYFVGFLAITLHFVIQVVALGLLVYSVNLLQLVLIN